ncbi:MFS transporter [Paracoccus sp. (in: a-proteobacteria)]|uniref:MFS transporter n=1 Tax=Paracoccus sp. TaxID=267 RepID=UPI0035AF4E20
MTQVSSASRRAGDWIGPRLAVSGLFLANGILLGSWAPKLPVLMQRLQISESTAGMMVLILGLGSVTMMPVCGAITARHGSAWASRLTAVLAAPTILLLSLMPGLWSMAVAIYLFGGFVGGMDVAMNANAVAVERARKRAIMSSCHGFWSVGAFIGAGFGGIALSLVGEVGHAVLVTLAVAGILALILPRVLDDAHTGGHAERVPLRLPRSALPYLIGLLSLCSMIPEGAIIDWAAVYLRRDLGSSVWLSGFGFGACAGAMAVMRFLGDGIRQRLGAVRTLRLGAIVGALGLVLAALAPTPGWAILGFALTGLGISNLVPIAFSAAGNLPGMAPGISMSVVTTLGYSGILVAPGLIGFIAEHLPFSVIFFALALLILSSLLFSRLAHHADFDHGDS